MKKLSILLGLVIVLLLVGSASGNVIDDKVYSALAPIYSEHLIKSFGPVSIDKTSQPLPEGIASSFKSFVDRDAWYKKLNKLYEKTKYSVDEKFSYPRGPVISYGYDALGSISVGIYDKQEVKEETIDQIYAFINDEAKKQGIDTLPVVFFSVPMPQVDLNRDDVWRPVIGGVQGANSIGAFTIGFAATRSGQEGGSSRLVMPGASGQPFTSQIQDIQSGPLPFLRGEQILILHLLRSMTLPVRSLRPLNPNRAFRAGTDPWLNLGVIKSGITTGVTSGTVISQTSLYNSFFGKTIYNQWYASFSSASGDSGSPVYFKDANQQIQIVGVYWGRGSYAVFSPTSSVLSDLS